MEISRLVRILNNLAPLKLAAEWDNVGLLVEPSFPHIVKHILLTNDLTEPVMDEAVLWKADMIVSYHPPIFKPIKKLTTSHWKDRIVICALENRIAIYSPHTACDAICTGVNDWLSQSLGEVVESVPIEKSTDKCSTKLVKLKMSADSSKLLNDLTKKYKFSINSANSGELEFVCKDADQVLSTLSPTSIDDVQIISLCPQPLPHTGMGRFCRLQKSMPIKDLINRIKSHLSLSKVRLALGLGCDCETQISTVALCAGSGASILQGISADIFLTGEMSHHEVLDAVANKTSVILCEHSNTERGYLKELAAKLIQDINDNTVKVKISTKDHDPIVVC